MAEYIYFLYKYTPVRHKTARTAASALRQYWNEQAIDYVPRQKSIISRILSGYQELKPSETRPSRPFSIFHFKKLLHLKLINSFSYCGKLQTAALSIGYFWGARVGEYAANSKEDWPWILHRGDLDLYYSENRLKSIVIDFKKHKANRWGLWNAKIAVNCSCNIGICGIHLLHDFVKIRDKEFGKDPNLPLLLQLKGVPMLQTHMRNLMKNIAEALELNPKFYVPHSLRAGRCTDLKRAKKPNWAIKKWGRWRSDCWMDYYLKLDPSDIAKLSNLSMNELGFQDN